MSTPSNANVLPFKAEKAPETSNQNQEYDSLLKLSPENARAFFLKMESYCNLDLPKYINFSPLLTAVSTTLRGKNVGDYYKDKPKACDNLNYTIITNKDGKYAWRPLQLIHPVLYVALVHAITEEEHWNTICKRFQEFTKIPYIECTSIPVESRIQEKDKASQIHHWLEHVEKRSIELALDYKHLIHTDITDCYGSIYTHSIAWAIHTKDTAKAKDTRNDKALIGNYIDSRIQDMQHGQTNGIPQGSTVMDFIAEMVLGYADEQLYKKLGNSVTDYHIIRYRDDYRIFTQNLQDGEKIVKTLTEVLLELGLKLNPSKTTATSSIIISSIKPDKLFWQKHKRTPQSLEKHLLSIYDLAEQFPHSGSLLAALNRYHKRLIKTKIAKIKNPLLLLSILVDIAYHNPRTYPITAAILSYLLSILDNKKEIIMKIRKRFDDIPNTEYLEIWLQRITLPYNIPDEHQTLFCKIVAREPAILWKNDWLKAGTLTNQLTRNPIVDQEEISKLTKVIAADEVALFNLTSY